MPFFALPILLFASALSVEAVTVANYAPNNCGANRMSRCKDLPPSVCCRFTDTSQPHGGMTITSPTNSVRWKGLQICDVEDWFYPSGTGTSRRHCGHERGSVTGSTAWACLSAGGNAHQRDGAMWYVHASLG